MKPHRTAPENREFDQLNLRVSSVSATKVLITELVCVFSSRVSYHYPNLNRIRKPPKMPLD